MSCIKLPPIPVPEMPPGFSLGLSYPIPTPAFPGVCCVVSIRNPLEDYAKNLAKAAVINVMPAAQAAAALSIITKGIRAVNAVLEMTSPKCPKE